MTTVATAEAVISASGGASVVQEFRKLSDAVNGVDDKAKSTTSGGLSQLKGALGSLGIGLTVAGLISAAEAIRQIGMESERSSIALNAMTGGQADVFIDQVGAATRGTVSDLAIMEASNRALKLGIVDTAEEMAGLTNAARVMGNVMGTDTASALNDLVTGIGRLSPMILDNLGITLSMAELEEQANAIRANSPGLTMKQAQTQALLNKVISEGNQLQAQGIGVMNTAADSNERFTAALKNKQAEMGEVIAANVQPIQDWAVSVMNGVPPTSALGSASANLRQEIAATSGTFPEFVENLRLAGLNTQVGRQGMVELAAEYRNLRIEALQAIPSVAGMTAGAAEHARAAQVEAVAVNELLMQIGPLTEAINQHNAEIETQSALTLGLLQNMGQFKTAYDAGTAALSQHDLTASETLRLYQELGLATGELSMAEINAANTQRELDNLWVTGNLSTQQYAAAVQQLQQGYDAVNISTQAQVTATNQLYNNLISQGVPAMEAWAQAQKDVQNAADGTTMSAADLSTMISDYNAALAQMNQPSLVQFRQQGGDALLELTRLINTGLGEMPTAHDIVFTDNAPVAKSDADKVAAALAAIEREITVTINIETNGSVPDLPGGNNVTSTGGGKAAGGPVSAGVPYVVGEGGEPEWFIPSTNGTIVPFSKMEKVGGGDTYNVSIYPQSGEDFDSLMQSVKGRSN